MTRPIQEIAILGGGLAGLSLAVELIRANAQARITVVDPRREYTDDRTWCFWDVMDHPYRNAVSHRWRQWRITTRAGVTDATCSRYPYCRLPAAGFYEAALGQLDDAANVTLAIGERVDSVADRDAAVHINTDARTIQADLAFDARPPEPTDWPSNGHPFLWQTFTGWRVRTDEPVWSTDAVDLMDFRDRPSSDAIGFVYILPLTAHEALVESTAFVPTDHPTRPDHDAHLRRVLGERLASRNYAVTARESGRIPMTSAPPPRSQTKRVVPIGTRAGAPRPSSGYAFLPIQRHSQRLARQLAAGEYPSAALRSAATRWLDGVFLRRLARDPESAPTLFQTLFARVPADRLVRFLTETGTWDDHLNVMSALPIGRFAAEALVGPWRALPRAHQC